MESKVYKIKDLVKTFKKVKDGRDKFKAKRFKLTHINRAPGSGVSGDRIAHRQGMYRLTGGSYAASGNYIIGGSVRTRGVNHGGYFYPITQGKATNVGNDNHYITIDNTFTHLGGIQCAEDLLVVGCEKYTTDIPSIVPNTEDDKSRIYFYDISNFGNIRRLNHLKIERFAPGAIAS